MLFLCVSFILEELSMGSQHVCKIYVYYASAGSRHTCSELLYCIISLNSSAVVDEMVSIFFFL